jgi:predicted nuclease of restriction endonuclease-like RecB superfamily
MDPIYFQDGLGNLLTPVWSIMDGVEVCSVLSTPVSIAPQIMKFRDAAPALLVPKANLKLINALDFTSHAVWYKSLEHWKSWIPTSALRASAFETEPALDLLAICFSRDMIPTEEILYEDYDSDHPVTPVD